MNTLRTSDERLTFRPEGPRTMVPTHLPLQRAWRWCVSATIRDLRVSERNGRVIGLPSLRRLFCRRWATVCWANDLPDDDASAIARRETGEQIVLTHRSGNAGSRSPR